MGNVRELNFIGLYPNPYLGKPEPKACHVATEVPKPSSEAQREKIHEMLKDPANWEADTNDFRVVMDQSKVTKALVCPTVIHLITYMYVFVYRPNGKRRGPLIDRVNILTHGNPQLVGLLGTVKGSDVNFCEKIAGPEKWKIPNPQPGKPTSALDVAVDTALTLDGPPLAG